MSSMDVTNYRQVWSYHRHHTIASVNYRTREAEKSKPKEFSFVFFFLGQEGAFLCCFGYGFTWAERHGILDPVVVGLHRPKKTCHKAQHSTGNLNLTTYFTHMRSLGEQLDPLVCVYNSLQLSFVAY